MRALRLIPFAIVGALLAFLALTGPGTLLKMVPGSQAGTTRATGTPGTQLDLSPPRRLAILNVQKVLGLPYSEGPCPADRSCLYGARERDGIGAAYVDFMPSYVDLQSGVHRIYQCTAYLLKSINEWYYVETACSGGVHPARETGVVPRLGATVTVFVLKGCVNVRADAGLLGAPSGCLANGTQAVIDGGPQQVDARIWWHLKGLGWMTHDVLLPADQSEVHSIVDDAFPHMDAGYGVCGSSGDLSACPYTARLQDRLRQTGTTLCRCPESFCCRTVGVDLNPAGWVSRVQTATLGPVFQLAVVRENGRFLIDDEFCAPRNSLDAVASTSIYQTTAPCTSLIPGSSS